MNNFNIAPASNSEQENTSKPESAWAALTKLREMESWAKHAENAGKMAEEFNYDKFKQRWENLKENADRRGINQETGLYQKGLTPVEPENADLYNRKKNIADKIATGRMDELSIGDKLHARDSIAYDFHGYKLKPDCCYRRVKSMSAIEYYQKAGFIDNNLDLKTLRRKDTGESLGGTPDTVDWFLGATSGGRYGNILIECPADPHYFAPVEKPGDHNLSADPDALHMVSSGVVDPIPFSKVKVLLPPKN